MTDYAELITAADRLNIRAGVPLDGVATLTCRVCGDEWRVSVAAYLSEPSVCLACWGGDKRAVKEIARTIQTQRTRGRAG